ncbi:MAG: ribbon-helix-helix protein, CopG family [Acidobacteria bacterium]|nr:ribbon-helix-helix protein, CopG family [Acidobacteriota bacterium]
METVQVVLNPKLLKAADIAAKRQKVNRSQLIRDALRRHLDHLRLAALEERDRRSYQVKPQRAEEYGPWEEAAAWPTAHSAICQPPRWRRSRPPSATCPQR